MNGKHTGNSASPIENGICAKPSEKCDDCRRKFWLAEVKNAETK